MSEAKRNEAVMSAELATWLSRMPTFSNFDAFMSAVFNSWVWCGRLKAVKGGREEDEGNMLQFAGLSHLSHRFCPWPKLPRCSFPLPVSLSFSPVFPTFPSIVFPSIAGISPHHRYHPQLLQLIFYAFSSYTEQLKNTLFHNSVYSFLYFFFPPNISSPFHTHIVHFLPSFPCITLPRWRKAGEG